MTVSPARIRALTLRQPWASLLVKGIKKHETRGWRLSPSGDCPTGVEVCAIHAGSSTAGLELLRRLLLTRETAAVVDDPRLPLSCVVGLAVFGPAVRCESSMLGRLGPQEFALGDFSDGRWAWPVVVAVEFHQPIPACGLIGPWTWDVPVKHQSTIAEALDAVRAATHLPAMGGAV